MTASCDQGRSSVITIRCNPEKSDQGDLSVPRWATGTNLRFTTTCTISVLLLSEQYDHSISIFCLFWGSSCLAGTCDGCTFHFLWESAAACPRCSKDDYHEIEGACKSGIQVGFTHTRFILWCDLEFQMGFRQNFIYIELVSCVSMIWLNSLHQGCLIPSHTTLAFPVMCTEMFVLLWLSPGNSVCVERAKVVHQRRAVAPQTLLPLWGHCAVADDRGWRRGLCGHPARLPHLLFLEEKPKVRWSGWVVNLWWLELKFTKIFF